MQEEGGSIKLKVQEGAYFVLPTFTFLLFHASVELM